MNVEMTVSVPVFVTDKCQKPVSVSDTILDACFIDLRSRRTSGLRTAFPETSKLCGFSPALSSRSAQPLLNLGGGLGEAARQATAERGGGDVVNNHKDSILKLLLSVMVGTLYQRAFKRDVDELLCEFAQCGSIFFAAFKKVWLSRKFSYIYEGRPTTNSSVFMQGLYAHCIGELKRLKELVIDAKKDTVDVVVALVKRMLDRCMFLFGSVDSVDGSLNQRVEEAKTLQSKLVQMAYEKLLANSRIEDYLHMDIGAELNIEGFKKMKSEYARAKELAVKEAAETVDIGDIKRIVESRDQVGEKLKVLVESWDDQKEDFRKQVGMVCGNEIVAADDFDDELELLLSKMPAGRLQYLAEGTSGRIMVSWNEHVVQKI
ncbi:hypothetical protein Taro_009448 [Colocasia esculenta]|uniref:Uncharacterized protein n=1 Tax=Colocasia esculenta TaxID=4460 RepID=A0A843TWD5_COLES|nr:hypothetical protein [Colocasia esculenta]